MFEAELQSLGSHYATDDDRISRRAAFYAHAARVFQILREMKLFRADRERLWTPLSGDPTRRATTRGGVQEQSRQKRELIFGKLDETFWTVDAAETQDDFQKASALMNECPMDAGRSRNRLRQECGRRSRHAD